MKTNETAVLLDQAIQNNLLVMLLGPAGVGKTHLIDQAARRNDHNHLCLSAPLLDLSYIRGYPHIDKSSKRPRAMHVAFDVMEAAFAATEDTVLTVDDFGMAGESVGKALVRFIQFRDIDDRKLPDCVKLVAASNDVGHGAGVYGMIEPLKSRFDTIVDVEPSCDEVIQYGVGCDWDAGTLVFIRNNPQYLYTLKPSKSMKVDGACPRGYEHASRLFKAGVNNEEAIAGAVGKEVASLLCPFRKLMHSLPDMAEIEMNPTGAMVPEDPSAVWMVATSVASKMACGTFGNYMKYLARIPEMFRAYSVKAAIKAESTRKQQGKLRNGKAIFDDKEFAYWITTKDGMNIMSAVNQA